MDRILSAASYTLSHLPEHASYFPDKVPPVLHKRFILLSIIISSDYLSSAILPVNLFTFFFAPQVPCDKAERGCPKPKIQDIE